ncbi:MAG: hypothetical protein JW395_2472 [Nitrospira sp.]|nr:hypothetical protein [Nitrospira sp.]
MATVMEQGKDANAEERGDRAERQRKGVRNLQGAIGRVPKAGERSERANELPDAAPGIGLLIWSQQLGPREFLGSGLRCLYNGSLSNHYTYQFKARTHQNLTGGISFSSHFI